MELRHRLATRFSLLAVVLAGVALPLSAKEYNLLLADHAQRHLFIRSSEGKIVWKHPGPALFEAWMQDDGSIVYTTKLTVGRIVPDLAAGSGGEVRWSYQFGTGDEKPLPEGMIYGCEPLRNGNFLITESGTFRLVEIDGEGKPVHVIKLPRPDAELRYSLRLTRESKRGTYLVPYFGQGKILEFDRAGKKRGEIGVGKHCKAPETSAYEAIPLEEGRLLVSCGPQDQVMILGKDGKPEWKLTGDDLPDDIEFHWITKLVPLENGNIIICNYCKGKAAVKAFEVTPEKKVVWRLTDEEVKGLTSLQVLDGEFRPVR
jgi:hypothetical protein